MHAINEHADLLTLITSPNCEIPPYLKKLRIPRRSFQTTRSPYTSEPSPIKRSNKPGYQRSISAFGIRKFDKWSPTSERDNSA